MKKPPGREAFAEIKKLDPLVIEEIDRRLTDGESPAKVGQWLQSEQKTFVGMKGDALKKMLDRYRAKEIREKMFKRIAGLQKGAETTTVIARVNALTSLEELAAVQRARVEKMLGLEKDKPLLLKSTSDEIHLLKDMLVDLGKMQMETGFLARASKTIKGTITDANGEVKTFEWTEELEKLYQELAGASEQEAA